MTYKRTDDTHTEIVATLRLLGCSVVSLASIGRGCPDIACAIQGKTYLIEIKNGSKKWKLEPDQKEFILNWKAEILILESVDDAHDFVASVRTNKFLAYMGRKFQRVE